MLELQTGTDRHAVELPSGWAPVSICLPANGLAVVLRCTKTIPVEFLDSSERRSLTVRISDPLVHTDPHRHRTAISAYRTAFMKSEGTTASGAGFHDEEFDGRHRFRWMERQASMPLPPLSTAQFLEFPVFSEYWDLSQVLTVTVTDEARTYRLPHGWTHVSVPLPALASDVRLTCDTPLPREISGDEHDGLSVRIGNPMLQEDPTRHRALERIFKNAVLNVEEMLAGKTVLTSSPRQLGIDMHGVCNVKPPCVYCDWDFAKEQEGEFVDTPFTADTLREYGPFYTKSQELVNCSIGEPFMMRQFDDLMDTFASDGKALEITTNGQILTDRNIQKLVGRGIELYISLDAATEETYAKLRNNTFSRLIDNVRRLVSAKGGPGRGPFVNLVFMPMRANVHELEAFIELCADLRPDRVILRPLNATFSDLQWERSGYRFSYENELLPWPELVRVSARAAAMCGVRGIALSDQMDFGDRLRDLYQQEFAVAQDAFSGDAAESTGGRPPEPAVQDGRGDDSLTAEPDKDEAGRRGPDQTTSVSAHERSDADSQPSRLGLEKLPVCQEPWKSLYILRRGIEPCCYGGRSIAKAGEYEEAWNATLLQDIRRHLARGEFHIYCASATQCPIVRKQDSLLDATYDAGFYPPEGDLPKRYRWMARTGVLTVEPTDAVRYLRLKVEAVCDGATPQVVTVVAGTFTDRYWVLGERSLTIPVSPGVTDIQLAVDKLVPPQAVGESRELGLMIHAVGLLTKATDFPLELEYRAGFYEQERRATDEFRWMTTKGTIWVRPQHQVSRLTLEIEPGTRWFLPQTVMVTSGGVRESYKVRRRRQVGITVPPGVSEVNLEVDRLATRLPRADTRELTVKVVGAHRTAAESQPADLT